MRFSIYVFAAAHMRRSFRAKKWGGREGQAADGGVEARGREVVGGMRAGGDVEVDLVTGDER